MGQPESREILQAENTLAAVSSGIAAVNTLIERGNIHDPIDGHLVRTIKQALLVIKSEQMRVRQKLGGR